MQAMNQWKQFIFLKYIRLYIKVVVANCYLERDNEKIFEISYEQLVEISTPLF